MTSKRPKKGTDVYSMATSYTSSLKRQQCLTIPLNEWVLQKRRIGELKGSWQLLHGLALTALGAGMSEICRYWADGGSVSTGLWLVGIASALALGGLFASKEKSRSVRSIIEDMEVIEQRHHL